ncbi:MAG: hypothetical protein ACO3CR_07715 [Solirubrobacterales bacterium]
MVPAQARYQPDREGLKAFVESDRRLEALRIAVGDTPAYLVGGSVRDLLLGRKPVDLDVAIEGDLDPVLRKLGGQVVEHPRFMTAEVSLDGGSVDLVRTRSETYERPGALPEVSPATLEQDLARRDFSINAIAVPLARPGEIVDPFGGIDAIAAGKLSLLGPGSLVDDPTRALRGARYAARFDFEPDREMESALSDCDLQTVSPDRIRSELGAIAGESAPELALERLRRWGVIEVTEGSVRGVGAARYLLEESDAWRGWAELRDVVAVAVGDAENVGGLPDRPPSTRIEQYELLSRIPKEEILLARAGGAEWLDWWPTEGSQAKLEIDGDDLIDAGVEPGPAVGVGLREALAECLESGGTDRARQLETAVEAARNVDKD